MTKQELRRDHLERRKKLTAAECDQRSLKISQLFFASLDLSFVKILHSFLPLKKNNEPDTWLILERIRREFPGIRISLPRVKKDSVELENIFFEGLHQLDTNEWGIQEPKQGIPTPVDKIDMVLVPLLAFDKYGHRVGYGRGYYDRFLKLCRKDCTTVGISFFDETVRIDDTDENDVALDACVTPARVIYF